jgi:hypothetical protein
MLRNAFRHKVIRHLLQLEICVSNFELTVLNFELDERSFCNSKFELVSWFFSELCFIVSLIFSCFFFHPVRFFRTLSSICHHTFHFLTCTVSFDFFISLLCFLHPPSSQSHHRSFYRLCAHKKWLFKQLPEILDEKIDRNYLFFIISLIFMSETRQKSIAWNE